MYSGKLVFAQVMDHLPMHTFRQAVRRYGGNRYVKSFPCHSQFLCMAFAQLTYRESCATSRSACGPSGASSITWAFATRCRATRWPTRTRLSGPSEVPGDPLKDAIWKTLVICQMIAGPQREYGWPSQQPEAADPRVDKRQDQRQHPHLPTERDEPGH